ncbi:MAG TPA: helix-turn-helix domain-containing protein [Jiangellaceae bacterium]|nr:helix-turn-helix domain-containing protein [Jiangellaceae bacterium]
MSIEASSFVLGLSMGQGNGIRKLILLGYANHADKHGRGAYPSTRTIADYAECDVRTVQRHLRWLIERGYLHEGDQRMVDHLDPRYRPIVYDVAMTAEQIKQWAAGTGPETGNVPVQRMLGAAAAAHRLSSVGVTMCHPCLGTHRRRSAGATTCHPWTTVPGVTPTTVQR